MRYDVMAKNIWEDGELVKKSPVAKKIRTDTHGKMKSSSFKLTLLAIMIAACWASHLLPNETKEYCPEFLQGNMSMPCWNLGSKCYCFSIVYFRPDWSRADAFCRGGNMTLLSVDSEEEDQLIFKHIRQDHPELDDGSYWTSGRFSGSILNGQWEWASTEPFQPFNYTNWYVGEPGFNKPGYCVYFYFGYYYEYGYWWDYPCDHSYGFICESN
ncbi:Uncharacterized protein APZ42_030905 [Daphnia magna]|uniref:C-type lectin domain-containing protein n=2 Tax=Daphnia magna TaxID=35525 RepID=A0A162DCV4_9CRUS|nr:Uncharacterized protein APZ42_030905 [Daphnia magna]